MCAEHAGGMEIKKDKKNWKILIIILLILFVAAGIGICYLSLAQVRAEDETRKPVLEEGQEYAYAKITSISGNEMEYSVLNAQTVDFNTLQENGSGRKEHGSGENGGGERRNKTAQDEEMTSAGGDQMENAPSVMTYTETGVTGHMQIPVGTEVETKLGTVTTFSRLSNGDIIRMFLQEDDTGNKVLMKIWIME